MHHGRIENIHKNHGISFLDITGNPGDSELRDFDLEIHLFQIHLYHDLFANEEKKCFIIEPTGGSAHEIPGEGAPPSVSAREAPPTIYTAEDICVMTAKHLGIGMSG